LFRTDGATAQSMTYIDKKRVMRTKLFIYLNQYQLVDTSAYAWTISLRQVFSAYTLAWLNLQFLNNVIHYN
jgi:hypothetical protein